MKRNKLPRKARSFVKDKSGQFAVITAIAAFPLLLATSFVIDFRLSEANRVNVKNAMDTAVLAAVSNENLNESEKIKLAKTIFAAHYDGDAKVDLDVKVADGRVQMDANGNFETSIAGAVGYEKFEFNEQSVAVMNRQNTICVLALAKQGRGMLRFLNDMEFKSPTCAVQSNSSDDQGMIASSSFSPVAKSFCSAGGASGSFFPAIRGECREIPDPYTKFTPPPPGDCMKPETFDMIVDKKGKIKVFNPTPNMLLNGHEDPGSITITIPGKHEHPHCHLKDPVTGAQQCHISNHKVGDIHAASDDSRLDNLGLTPNDISRLIVDYGLSNLEVPESTNYTRAGRTYKPGTYCGGLTVDGVDVKFDPGTYIMKDGPLTFKNGATATAKDVSFVLYGPTSVVTVESGSYVDVKAPKTGPLAGLAFYQDESVVNPNIKLPPVGVNLLSSGGELNVTGTMYFPDQALDVLGDSVLGAKAPATSFIAYQVTFAGSTKAEVKVDHIAGEIPAMVPLSDDGARLVQ